MRKVSIAVFVLTATLFVSAPVSAATWPGAAPCNGTLQACIDATAVAGTVDVASNSVIDETLFVSKPFTLRAAAGYRPILEAGRVISGSVNAAGSWSWTVEGFELRQGFISVSVAGGTQGNIAIRRNRVRSALSGAAEISVFTSAATTLLYDIRHNELDYSWSEFDGALRAAIQVLDSFASTSSHASAGRIIENRVIARGSQSIGILVSTSNRIHSATVFANHVRGGNRGSIYLRLGSLVSATGGSLTTYIINNVVRSVIGGEHDADGIAVELFDGAATLTVVNNTVVDSLYGVDIYSDEAVTSLSGAVQRNVFAHTLSRGLSRVGGANATNLPDDHNLFFDTSDTPAQVDATSLFADPLFVRAPEDLHLAAGSPAIDAVPSPEMLELLVTYGLPLFDGDGLRRFKRGSSATGSNTLDLGALEAGDVTLLHMVDNSQPSPDNISVIDHPSLNAISNVNPQVTPNWNPDAGTGLYNDHPVSVGYSSGTAAWTVRQEDLLAFPNGVRFNLFVPGTGDGQYRHQPNAGNTSGGVTTLTEAGLSGSQNLVVLASRDWSGSATVNDLIAPFGVRYNGVNWQVATLDGSGMPLEGGFDIYFQEATFNAFRVIGSAGNIGGNVMVLDHALLNGNRCARFHITRSAAGTINNHDVGVFYSLPLQRWGVFNQDLAAMPAGVEFHVVIDPNGIECQGILFANGFE